MAVKKSPSGSLGGFKIKLKFTAGTIAQVSNLVKDKFKALVMDKAVSTFIEINPTANEKAVLEGGSLFTDSSSLGAGPAPLSTYKGANDLKRLYVKAWQNTYKGYIVHHMSMTPEAKYSGIPWVKHKRRNQGSPSKFMPSRPLKYKTHSLATGYLRDSIAQAFEDGGDSSVSVFNLLVKGGYKWNKSYLSSAEPAYHKWIETVSKGFQSGGMYAALGGDKDNIVQFGDKDWQDISKLMLQIYKDGPVEDVKNLLTTFTIEV